MSRTRLGMLGVATCLAVAAFGAGLAAKDLPTELICLFEPTDSETDAGY